MDILNNYFNGNKLVNSGIETELQLYSPQIAGDSENIWPLISKNWNKTHSLGIKSPTNSTINFLFIANNEGKIDEPILGRGTFTAVYQIKNENDKTDSTKYILRLYSREFQISKKHMVYNEKVMNEYNLYGKYLIKIFYYGELKIVDEKFDFSASNRDPDLDTYTFKQGTKKKYNFDHVITKEYMTPTFDKNYNIIGITNLQKYLFLYNNIKMLSVLTQNNSFHADYKIGNVGWEDSDQMNVIMIDYDTNTIQHLDKLNKKIIVSNGYVTSIRFPSTYIPEFIKDGDGIKSVPAEQYIKYSIGGLHNIMKTLNIAFNEERINLPSDLIKSQKITKINSNDLGKSFKLDSRNYNDIPEYDEMLAILGWLYVNKKIT